MIRERHFAPPGVGDWPRRWGDPAIFRRESQKREPAMRLPVPTALVVARHNEEPHAARTSEEVLARSLTSNDGLGVVVMPSRISHLVVIEVQALLRQLLKASPQCVSTNLCGTATPPSTLWRTAQ